MTIIVIQRTADWHASIEGHPEKWENGRTPEEAIGKLMVTRGAEIGVRIEGVHVTSSGRGGSPRL